MRGSKAARGGLGIAVLTGAAVFSQGCASIGERGSSPDGLPHGGTGQFRPLDEGETGIAGPPAGRAIVLADVAVESGMPAGEFLFYAQARALDEAPEPRETHPPNEIFWEAFGPRAIHRASARPEGTGAFDFGPKVLAASEAWEEGEVYDPWAVASDGGPVRLYYAAAGGIGVAEAPSLDARFSKLPGPILTASDAGGHTPRRPSVVRGVDGSWWMYFSAGTSLFAARSSDGVRFSVVEGLSFVHADGESDQEASDEVAMIHPAAVRVDTPAGRTLIRLYFESVRADGARKAYVAGSEDGLRFVRHPRPAMAQDDVRFVAPILLDWRTTLLYANVPHVRRGRQTRAIVVTVSPAGERLSPDGEND